MLNMPNRIHRSVCSGAQGLCTNDDVAPLAGNWDVYDVPTENPDSYPPPFDKYLNSDAVTSNTGSHAEWEESNPDVYSNFAVSGDLIRTSLPDLEEVIKAGVRTVIYDGDADYLVNYMGVGVVVRGHPPTHIRRFSPFALTHRCVLTGRLPKHKVLATVRGAQVREFHRQWSASRHLQECGHVLVDSYVRFFGAGHEVPAYLWRSVRRDAAALQMFMQIMSGKQLSGT